MNFMTGKMWRVLPGFINKLWATGVGLLEPVKSIETE